MIRTCLFDMGNVLVFFSHDLMCDQMGALCGKAGSEIRHLIFDSGLLIDFECGRLTESEFHRAFENAVGRSVDDNDLRIAASDIFRLNPSMPGILDALKARGIRLVLLSNTSISHFDWVRSKYDLMDRFDSFVLSYEVGAIKPEKAIFEAALTKIDCEPGECFYTDDIADYVVVSRRFGLQAETYTDVATLTAQLRSHGIDLNV